MMQGLRLRGWTWSLVCLVKGAAARAPALLLGVWLVGAAGAPSQVPKTALFPAVSAEALDKTRIALPGGLEGRVNLLLLSFAADQQNQLGTWMAPEQALQHTDPGFRYYRLPVAERENAIFRWWANASLRSEETDSDFWHWLVPLYVDKHGFLAQLGIADEKSIVALLVDREGHVLWRATGASTAESRAGLAAATSATH